jgi:ribosomal protein L11 methyltransferase
MPFLQLTLAIASADPAPFEDALFELGASAVSLADAADNPILEPKPGELPLWPTVTVTALFQGDANADAILKTLQSQFSPLPTHEFTLLEDRAWEREWLKDFKPMQFGKRLWICPGGMLPPSELLLQPTAHSLQPCLISLDPGLAFGTGNHPTTALCLEWLDSADVKDKYVIDYGCGSGILAIAALKLGAREALGTDIDPQALLASRDNAERNEVSARLHLRSCDFATGSAALPTPARILLANILAGPLGELAPLFARLVTPGGAIVLSGILKEQAPALAQTYAAWFDMDPPAYREDWARLVGRRRNVADSG